MYRKSAEQSPDILLEVRSSKWQRLPLSCRVGWWDSRLCRIQSRFFGAWKSPNWAISQHNRWLGEIHRLEFPRQKKIPKSCQMLRQLWKVGFIWPVHCRLDQLLPVLINQEWVFELARPQHYLHARQRYLLSIYQSKSSCQLSMPAIPQDPAISPWSWIWKRISYPN